MRLASIRTGIFLALAAAALPGCTKQQLQGQGSSYLIIDRLTAKAGTIGGDSGAADESNVLESDVLYQTDEASGIVADLGRAIFRLGMKDPGSANSPTEPTSANFITVTRYEVRYLRSDGKTTPGVDVPFGFSGAATGTISGEGGEILFTLVRVQAKAESPLVALIDGGALSTLAEVTFFGQDQAGRTTSVKGMIGINFANYANE